MAGIDVTNELNDLLKVYTDAEEHLKKKERDAHDIHISYMKRYLDIHEERKKVSEKLATLKGKIEYAANPGCCGQDECEEDERE